MLSEFPLGTDKASGRCRPQEGGEREATGAVCVHKKF